MIRNNELLPHPLGPEIIKFMPGLILKVIFGTKTSPVGEMIGTSENSRFSPIITLPFALISTSLKDSVFAPLCSVIYVLLNLPLLRS